METGKTCTFPSLPENRGAHSIDTFNNLTIICGGTRFAWDESNTCLQFSSGVWTNYTNTMEKRFGHTSWVSSAGLVLVGGYDDFDLYYYGYYYYGDTGFHDNGPTAEIVPSGGQNFSLIENTG